VSGHHAKTIGDAVSGRFAFMGGESLLHHIRVYNPDGCAIVADTVLTKQQSCGAPRIFIENCVEFDLILTVRPVFAIFSPVGGDNDRLGQ